MTPHAILYQERPLLPELPSLEPPPSKQPKVTKKTTSSAKPPTCELTQRDSAILLDLYTARYMTAVQLQALHWQLTYGNHSGPERASQRRLLILTKAGLLRRIEPFIRISEGKKPFIYALDKAAIPVLAEHYGIDPKTIEVKPHSREDSYPFMAHTLDVVDLHIAFKYAATQVGVHLETWHYELELRSEGMTDVVYLEDPDGTKHKTAVVPDALAVVIRADKKGIFMLENDRRTVVINGPWEKRSWSRKIRQYLAYFASDVFKQRYGGRVAQVLTITTGPERLEHLKQATEAAGGDKRFWFTTADLAKDHEKLLTQPIWTRAGMEGLHALLR